MRVVATAGHVDHGKSALVLALTGTDPDRFPEEKARGLTIDLGFAFTTLSAERSARERSARERSSDSSTCPVTSASSRTCSRASARSRSRCSSSPRTRGGCRRPTSTPASSSCSASNTGSSCSRRPTSSTRRPSSSRSSSSTTGSPTAPSAAGPSSPPTRSRAAGSTRCATRWPVLAAAPVAADRGRPRLWVDRSFAARGAGTVVTGTLGGGTLAVDDDVVIEPGGRHARVRGIESHHERLDRVGPGARRGEPRRHRALRRRARRRRRARGSVGIGRGLRRRVDDGAGRGSAATRRAAGPRRFGRALGTSAAARRRALRADSPSPEPVCPSHPATASCCARRRAR